MSTSSAAQKKNTTTTAEADEQPCAASDVPVKVRSDTVDACWPINKRQTRLQAKQQAQAAAAAAKRKKRRGAAGSTSSIENNVCSPKRDSDHLGELECFEEGPQPTEQVHEDKKETPENVNDELLSKSDNEDLRTSCNFVNMKL